VLRAVISFLVAVPLLVPPGMCACRIVLPGPAPGSAESAGVCQKPQRDCCAHRKIAVKLKVDDHVASRGSASSREKQHPTRPGKTHEPGCPALLTADHSKLAGQNHGDAPSLTVQHESARTLDAMPTTPTRLAGAHGFGPAPCPLYLSLRCLLI
jgi:hypothetical protein